VSELLWPGDGRAGSLLSDDALVRALTAVESAWLRCLVDAGIAPALKTELPLVSGDDVDHIERGGNAVIPLLNALRSATLPPTRDWLHRGLTSQDVLDTALVLCLRDAADAVLSDVDRQAAALRALADTHRRSVTAGRTLTQHAVPTTFGATAAAWLNGILDAAEDLAAARDRLPVQLGGAAGTLAGVVAVGGTTALADGLASELGLQSAPPWPTNRRPLTRLTDALTACVDAFGKVANDVLLRARPEVGELEEAVGGGSSTMSHKHNPVLAVLVKRAAILMPHLGAAVHSAAAAAVDERPDGGWHAEWLPLRLVARTAATAASQTADLLAGLQVNVDRMRATADSAAESLLSEQQSLTGSITSVDDYLGAVDRLVEDALSRADAFRKDRS
jgi:3-carboxy-cis,cis-muconate cycloisomerase